MSRIIVSIMMILGVGYMMTPEEKSESIKNTNTTEFVKLFENESYSETKASEVASSGLYVLADNENNNSEEYSDYMDVLDQAGPKESQPFNNSANSNTENSTNSTVETNSEPLSESSESKVINEEESIADESSNNESEEEKTNIVAVDHSSFGQLLQKHVNSKGNVDYKSFKADEGKLDAYLEMLENNPVQNSWSKNERLAYWINVYNAFTIKLILDNYPVSSIKDINGGKPWDKLFIKLGNTSYTLNKVENDIIRKRFNEPRIHFAVNCAAKSCPPLLNDAYYPDKLMSQLSERTNSFISNSNYNTITDSKLKVSKIFDWYSSDFGDVKDFISRYTSSDIKGNNLEFMDYDWALNKQ